MIVALLGVGCTSTGATPAPKVANHDAPATTPAPAPTPAPTGDATTVPQVRITEPTVGTDDRMLVTRYIKRSADKFTDCIDQARRGTPALHGTVQATFVIAADGTVQTSSATGVRDDVARCVAAVITGIAFPRPSHGAVTISYPFVFAPTGG